MQAKPAVKRRRTDIAADYGCRRTDVKLVWAARSAWVGIKSVVVVCNEWLKTKRSSKGLLAARQRLQEVKESKRGKRRRGKAGGIRTLVYSPRHTPSTKHTRAVADGGTTHMLFFPFLPFRDE